MQYKYFFLEDHIIDSAKKIAIITIQNPPMNALSQEVLLELQEIVSFVSKKYTVAIITGKVGKSFIAGADIKEMQKFTPQQAKDFASLGQDVFFQIENSPTLFICAINGFTLGGGLELSLACSIRLCTENSIFSFPEVSLGLIPGFGGTQKLSKNIGIGNAILYTTTGMRITAIRAFEMGLVQEVVASSEKLLERSLEIGKQILKNGPQAVSMVKQLVYSSIYTEPKEGCKNESFSFQNTFSNGESKEGIKAFLEKRSPDFSQ